MSDSQDDIIAYLVDEMGYKFKEAKSAVIASKATNIEGAVAALCSRSTPLRDSCAGKPRKLTREISALEAPEAKRKQSSSSSLSNYSIFLESDKSMKRGGISSLKKLNTSRSNKENTSSTSSSSSQTNLHKFFTSGGKLKIGESPKLQGISSKDEKRLKLQSEVVAVPE